MGPRHRRGGRRPGLVPSRIARWRAPDRARVGVCRIGRSSVGHLAFRRRDVVVRPGSALLFGGGPSWTRRGSWNGVVTDMCVAAAADWSGVGVAVQGTGPSTKSEVCAICVERSRGRTVRVHLGRGVSVWLCAGHASDDFRRRRGGRDFVLTLHRLWSAHGCLTKPRSTRAGRPPGRDALGTAGAATSPRVVLVGSSAKGRRATVSRRGGPGPRDPRAAQTALRRRGHGAERADDAPLVSGAALAAAGAGRRDQRAGCANWPSERRPIGRPLTNHSPAIEGPTGEREGEDPTARSP